MERGNVAINFHEKKIANFSTVIAMFQNEIL